jgi:hypothetical protein
VLAHGVVDGAQEELTLVVEVPALVLARRPDGLTPEGGVGRHGASIICAARAEEN